MPNRVAMIKEHKEERNFNPLQQVHVMRMSKNDRVTIPAAIHASRHSLRIPASRGLVSPNDIDESLDGVTETLANLDPQLLVIVQNNLDPIFAQIKEIAVLKWKAAE